MWCVFVLSDGGEKKKEEKREKGRDLSKPKKIENSPPTTGKHTHKQGVCACSFLFFFFLLSLSVPSADQTLRIRFFGGGRGWSWRGERPMHARHHAHLAFLSFFFFVLLFRFDERKGERETENGCLL